MSVLKTLKEKIVGPTRRRLFAESFLAWSQSNERTATAPSIVPGSRRLEPLVSRGKATVKVSLKVEGDAELLSLYPQDGPRADAGNGHAGGPLVRWRFDNSECASAHEHTDPQIGWLENDSICAEFPIPGRGNMAGPHQKDELTPLAASVLKRTLDTWEREIGGWIRWLGKSIAWHNQRVESLPAQREAEAREAAAREAREEERRQRLKKHLETVLARIDAPATDSPDPMQYGRPVC